MTTTDTYHRNLDAKREHDIPEIGERAANYVESETRYGWEFLVWWMRETAYPLTNSDGLVLCEVCDRTNDHQRDCPIGLGL